MTVFSSDDKPDPFIPACLTSPASYDATIELLYEDDPEATEKRAVVRREEVEA